MADSAMTREVLRDIAKRPVDVSGLDVHVTHGVVYLRGRMEKLRGYYEDTNLEEELHIIVRTLRQKSGISDVCCEVTLGGETIRERLSPHVKRARY